jgi:hypothetical protein
MKKQYVVTFCSQTYQIYATNQSGNFMVHNKHTLTMITMIGTTYCPSELHKEDNFDLASSLQTFFLCGLKYNSSS